MFATASPTVMVCNGANLSKEYHMSIRSFITSSSSLSMSSSNSNKKTPDEETIAAKVEEEKKADDKPIGENPEEEGGDNNNKPLDDEDIDILKSYGLGPYTVPCKKVVDSSVC